MLELKVSTQVYTRHIVVTFRIPALVTVKVLGFWDVTPSILIRVKVRVRVKVKVNVKVKVKFSPVTCNE